MKKAGGLLLVVVLLAAGGALWSRRAANVTSFPEPVEPPPPRLMGAWAAPAVPTEVKLTVEVTQKGAPVSGAEVLVTRDGQATLESLSDAAGLAHFSLPPGAVHVAAEAHGVSARQVTTLSSLLGDTRLALALEIGGGRIDVNVTDSVTKQPLEGALVEIHVSSEEPRLVLQSLRTDAAGHATARGLVPNRYLASISRDGYLSERSHFVSTGGVDSTALVPHQRFIGRVLLPDGGPAAGAQVTTERLSWEEPATARTRRDGTFTLPYTVAYRGLCAQLGDLVGGGDLTAAADGGLLLARAPRFEGLVLRDEDDAPLEGVRVHTVSGALESTDTSTADGHFSLPGLCDRRAYATFERAGWVTEGELLSLEEPTTVHLSAPSAVRGRVVDDLGHGVAGAQVALDEPSEVTVTDADGRFGFERVKRNVRLSATEGHRGGHVSVLVEAGQLMEVTISIGPARVRVPLQVLIDGKPAGGVWNVVAQRIDGRPFEAKTIWHARGRISDVIYATEIALPEGSFKVRADSEEGQGEAELRVFLSDDPSPPLRIHATAAAKALKPTRPLPVRVLDARGEPVEDAGVNCVAQNWGFTRTGADGRGACGMEDELPIVVRVRVGGAVASAVPKDWNTELLLQLKDSMTIRGRVLGADAGVGYAVEVNSVEELEHFPITTPEFLLEDRPSVRSILCVFFGGGSQGCTVVLPRDGGGEVEATIPVGPPGGVRFTVADARGQPVGMPVLYVDRFSTRPPVDGGVVWLPLVPGQHVLIVNVAGGPERYETILTVEPGRYRDLGRIDLK